MAFEEIIKNKDLWFVREDERIVFESTQTIDMGKAQPGSVRDVEMSRFSSHRRTFPRHLITPIQTLHRQRGRERCISRIGQLIYFRAPQFVNAKTMYEYFVRVTLTNGTTAEIQAGFTAFYPLYDPPGANLVRSKAVQLQMKESLNGSLIDSDPVANYTAKIISNHDHFAFSQGSDSQVVKVAIARIRRARTFVEPLNLHLCIDSSVSPKWGSKHTSMPNASDTVTTTTKPIPFPINPDLRQSTDFETYYQTLFSALFLSLGVPRTQDEPLDSAGL